MGFWDKVKKVAKDTGNAITNTTNTVVNTTVDTANTVAHTTVDVANTVANTTVEWYNDSQQIIICSKAIANCAMDVQGHDPRKWMSSCAAETIFKGEGPEYFKGCLVGKMQTEIKDLSDPVGYANKLWDKIEGSCS